MTDYTVKRLALVLAVQAEIEGMKIANAERLSNNCAPAYSESAFNEAARQLETLAHKHDEEL